MVSESIYVEKGVLGGGEGGGQCPPEANDIWKYQIKWNHFHHMGPEYFFHYFWGHIIFSTLLEPFYFLHIKNQNMFLDKNPAPPNPKQMSHVMRKRVLPYANNKGADQPAHPRSLISAFVIRYLDNIIPILAKSKLSRL